MENNDYELVVLAQENNEDARELIYQKYKPIIIKKSKNAFLYAPHYGMEISDIMQEGYIGLEEAIKSFSQDDTATFYTFATICIDRKISNYMKKMQKDKNKLLNEAVTIDSGLENLISDKMNIEKTLISNVKINEIIKQLRLELTEFERNVFDLKIKDYSFEEIANTLNKDTKSIYNTFHRIKQKVKRIIEIDDY